MALFYFLVFISLCIACCKVDARSKALLNEQNHFTASDNTMLQVDNDFECVDIYKQPALQHPLLKNHKIQLYPTFAKNVVRSRPSYDGECPTGKVPIYKRTKRHQIVTNSSSKLPIEDLRHYANRFNEAHTVTLDTSQNQIFYGGSALISAYNLSLNLNQYSTSSVIVESGPRAELNSIHAGVGVRPDIYHDSQLRLTSYWTAFGSAHSGCSDTQCPGFVQVTQDKHNFLGSVVSPATPIGASDKLFLATKIQRDRSTGNWWLIIDEKKEIHVGYWPKEIFTHLSNGASKVRFGGETAAITVSPPMGSGRLPQDGFQYSALMGLLQHIDTNYNQIDLYPALLKVYNDAKKECYDLKFYEALGGKLYRRAILYGGPGGQCNL
ncbi:uncharacterized protein LOC123913593 [Trifolium pratense]|uniref:uncharacterized protein LOC123913593 n=1 Tax=Trifolium pratense TaxID=57577 RepID=UPI001E696169|nr:uncharacterized protein LOC123913593 [Trifolium pratense]